MYKNKRVNTDKATVPEYMRKTQFSTNIRSIFSINGTSKCIKLI